MKPVSSDETPAPHTDGLLPCPFCGEKQIHVGHWRSGNPQKAYAECMGCLAKVWGYDSKREAIIAWNRRWPVSSSSSQPQVTREEEEAGGAESTDTRGSKEEEQGWIRTALRPPTKEDGDIWGNVFVREDEQGREGVDVTSVENVIIDQWPYWMRIPPVPKE